MIWKIENYPEKKDETVNGTRDSVLSHPFYTHRYGYKLMLQVTNYSRFVRDFK